MSRSKGYKSGLETPTNKILQAQWMIPLPPLIMTGHCLWLAKEELKAFQGLAADEQTMLVTTINAMCR
jgi:hypothetical protein